MKSKLILMLICINCSCAIWSVTYKEKMLVFDLSENNRLEVMVYKYNHGQYFISSKKAKQWTEKEIDSVGTRVFHQNTPRPIVKKQKGGLQNIRNYHLCVSDTSVISIDSIVYQDSKYSALVKLIAKKIGPVSLCAINSTDTICNSIIIDNRLLNKYHK